VLLAQEPTQWELDLLARLLNFLDLECLSLLLKFLLLLICLLLLFFDETVQLACQREIGLNRTALKHLKDCCLFEAAPLTDDLSLSLGLTMAADIVLVYSSLLRLDMHLLDLIESNYLLKV